MSNLGLPSSGPIDYSSRDFASTLTDLVNQIPNFLPEWTDRAPGDLGIALLELFSLQADVLNYYIDRVANEAFLSTAQQRQSILNIASLLDYIPYGNVAATVNIQFTINNPSTSPVFVPFGTKVSTPAVNGGSISFSTVADLTIYGDNTRFTVLNATGTGQANQQIVLTGPYDGQTQSVVINGNQPWIQSPDNLFTGHGYSGTSQVYVVLNGKIIAFGDGVHGAKPANGAAIVITYYPAGSGTAGASQYSASVAATQGVVVTGEIIGASDGTASQTLTIFQSPIVDGSIQVFVDEGSGPIEWTKFDRPIDANSTDLAFTTVINAQQIVQVTFGDGINGRIPVPGAVITANYTVGGGSQGNVAANTLTVLSQSIPGVVSVTNPAPAVGGSEAETIDHIRTHAPLSLTAVNRAVTAQDYANLSLSIPAVAKASATALSVTVISLCVHPVGGFYATPSALSGAVSTLATLITNPNGATPGFLDDKKMAFTSVQVIPPQYHNGGSVSAGYVPVDITINPLVVLPQFRQGSVQQAVLAAVNSLLAFDSVDFGSRVTLASVYQAFQAVPGVAYGTVTVLARHEAGPVVGDVVCASDEIPQANVVVVTASGGLA